VLQILVYAGAIMVLFVFVVMMVNREESTPIARQGLVTRAVGVLAAGYVFYRACWLASHERAMLCCELGHAAGEDILRTVSSWWGFALLGLSLSLRGDLPVAPGGCHRGVMLTRHAREDGPRVS